MRKQQQVSQRQHYDDLRTLDHHESWIGVYALFDVELSIEPEKHESGVHAVPEEYIQP